MKYLFSIASLTTLICSSAFCAQTLQAPNQGTLNVTVLDENGKAVQDAPVYIYGEHRTHFVGGADIPGSTTFSMKEGKYRISSALVQKNGEYIDRFSSNEAHINVEAGDHVSVILTLKPLRIPEQQPLSYATLHVAGIPISLLN